MGDKSNRVQSSETGSGAEMEPVEVSLPLGSDREAEESVDQSETGESSENKPLMEDLNINPHHNTPNECLECSCDRTALKEAVAASHSDVESTKHKQCSKCSGEATNDPKQDGPVKVVSESIQKSPCGNDIGKSNPAVKSNANSTPKLIGTKSELTNSVTQLDVEDTATENAESVNFVGESQNDVEVAKKQQQKTTTQWKTSPVQNQQRHVSHEIMLVMWCEAADDRCFFTYRRRRH